MHWLKGEADYQSGCGKNHRQYFQICLMRNWASCSVVGERLYSVANIDIEHFWIQLWTWISAKRHLIENYLKLLCINGNQIYITHTIISNLQRITIFAYDYSSHQSHVIVLLLKIGNHLPFPIGKTKEKKKGKTLTSLKWINAPKPLENSLKVTQMHTWKYLLNSLHEFHYFLFLPLCA